MAVNLPFILPQRLRYSQQRCESREQVVYSDFRA